MTKARTVLPTDLVALVSFDGRVYPNEAKTWDRMGAHERGPHPLETAIEQWFSFATGKHTWVNVRGATIRGLISARPRAKRSVWEVDCLINADDDAGICLSLLERMARDIGRAGAERVFLRLNADSPLLDIVRSAGFFTYTQERLFRRDEPVDVKMLNLTEISMRPRSPADLWGLFQLYQAVAPANVRSIEGLTLREWQASQERWGGRPRDFVLEEAGCITAWLRLSSGSEGRFHILADNGRGSETAVVVRAALSQLAGKALLLCLLPIYADELAPALGRLDFRLSGEYVLLAKRLLKTAEEPASEHVGHAVPVS